MMPGISTTIAGDMATYHDYTQKAQAARKTGDHAAAKQFTDIAAIAFRKARLNEARLQEEAND